jgi:predicted nuclease of predicted toxin-antitoxin system
MRGLGPICDEADTMSPDHTAGMSDEEVVAIAVREKRILITRHLDFGRLVFVDRHVHAGVILLRLDASPSLSTTTDRLDDVLTNHANDLDRFLVVTSHLIRVR